MAIDTPAKRRSVSSLHLYAAGPGVTPAASPDQAWRQAAGYGYLGILAEAPVVPTALITLTLPARSLVLTLPARDWTSTYAEFPAEFPIWLVALPTLTLPQRSLTLTLDARDG